MNIIKKYNLKRAFKKIDNGEFFKIHPEAEIIKNRLKNYKVCLDIGGHKGEYSYFLSKYSQVYYFEPTRSSFDLAKKFLKRVFMFNAAIGEKNKFSYIKKGISSSENFISDRGEPIVIIKLDDFIDFKVDFIKIDVEGYERFVVLGLKEIIDKYFPDFLIEIKEKNLDLIYFFENKGYNHTKINSKDYFFTKGKNEN